MGSKAAYRVAVFIVGGCLCLKLEAL